MNSPIVRLTEGEVAASLLIAAVRRLESNRSGREDNHHGKKDPWMDEIDGAAAEIAYCKFRGQFWSPGVNTFHGADHGTKIQIRSTQYDTGCLIIRPKEDPPSHYYVLATGHIPVFQIRGWILGKAGMLPQYLKSPNGRPPAYFVPQSLLTPFKK